MIKIYSNIIPPSGFIAMTVYPFLFIRKKMACFFDEKDERHENIHGMQQLEMLVVGILSLCFLAFFGCGWWSFLALPIFFWWYYIEMGIRYILYGNRKLAYKNISFEQEAFLNESDVVYLSHRKPFDWLSFLFKKSFVRDPETGKIVLRK